ncbi:hypothetical protein NMY22_g9008 [Coprinellus aureogranulatus]|nr:hypothetical protein NMY22_g9008 [Coprinellus aureogranulatus]
MGLPKFVTPSARKLTRTRWIAVVLVVLLVLGYVVHNPAWTRGGVHEAPEEATAFEVATEPWQDKSGSLVFPHPLPLARVRTWLNCFAADVADSRKANEFIAYMHIIYLGMLSGRIPIIPPVVPTAHIKEDAPPILFSTIFNLTFARAKLRLPILEWADVKTPFPGVTALHRS